MKIYNEIIEELIFNDKFLSSEYKNSKEYRNYLDIICNDLKRQTKIITWMENRIEEVSVEESFNENTN